MPALRQLHQQEFLYDFATHGGAVSAISLGSLPVGAVPVRAIAIVETPVTSDGSATVQLGNTTDDDQLIASAAKTTVDVAGKVIGGDANAFRQILVANDQPVAIKIGTAALTAGKLRFVVEFYMPSSASVGSAG